MGTKNSKRLIQTDIIAVLSRFSDSIQEVVPLTPKDKTDWQDLLATYEAAKMAKTIIFPTSVALSELEEGNPGGLYDLPFQSVIIQFTSPMPESALLRVERTASMMAAGIQNDYILGMVLSQVATRSGMIINSASLWFRSSSVNRASWDAATGQFKFDPLARLTGWRLENKRRIRLLAVSCVNFINRENVILDRVAMPTKVAAKRRRKGKSVRPDFYICRIKKIVGPSSDKPHSSGSSHGVRYDVRGHYRRLKSGKTVWVRPHQRGLKNDNYMRKAYTIGGQK